MCSLNKTCVERNGFSFHVYTRLYIVELSVQALVSSLALPVREKIRSRKAHVNGVARLYCGCSLPLPARDALLSVTPHLSFDLCAWQLSLFRWVDSDGIFLPIMSISTYICTYGIVWRSRPSLVCWTRRYRGLNDNGKLPHPLAEAW